MEDQYACFKCSKRIQGALKGLTKHLRHVHAIFEGCRIPLLCGQDGCLQTFQTMSSFRRHIHRLHKGSLCTVDTTFIQEQSVDVSDTNDETSPIKVGEPQKCNRVEFVVEQASMFAATLKARAAVTENTVSMVVNQTVDLTGTVVDNLQGDLQQYISESNISLTDQQMCDITQIFEKHRNPFKGIETTYLRDQYFAKKFKFIEPQEHVLGTRYENTLRRNNATLTQHSVINAMYYISPLQVIKMIMSKEFIRKHLTQLTLRAKPVDSKLNDFADGSCCQNHPLFSVHQDAFQICIYTDEIETVNPLGSKTKIHKLGLVYFVFKNFPHYLNSRLDFIHTAIVYNAADQRRYGWNAVFEPLVQDMKRLEKGVEVSVDGRVSTIHAAIVALCADNLAANSALGFVECFAANYPCRFCLLSRADMSTIFVEDDRLLRNRVNYDEDVTVCSSSAVGNSRGVKSQCALNELQYFHCTENSVVDIMHDLCEGVFKHELKHYLTFLVFNAKYFTLETLNSRIKSFPWGFNDRRNRPSEISREEIASATERTLKGKATEVWCLLRNLPLLVGDLVPPEDNVWQLLCQLVQISAIVFSPSCSIPCTFYLKHLIHDHLAEFKDLFPAASIIPKQHFMIHYPRMIRLFGPLCHMWCMRFEGKHLYAKQLCSTVKCFKNIAKTVAHRYQHTQMMLWASGTLASDTHFGKGQSIIISNLKEKLEILNAIPNCCEMTEVYVCEQSTVTGLCYRSGMSVLIQTQCDNADSIVLGLIIYCIALTPDSPLYLVCKELPSNEYDSHFCGYRLNVNPVSKVTVICQSSLQYPWPLDIVQGFGMESYVSLRYRIM